MFYPPELVEVLEAIEPRAIEATIYRHMPGDYTPERANTQGARWNPPQVAAIYASFEPETALTEADYHISLQTPPLRIKRTLYTVRVSLTRVIEIRSADVFAALGLPSDLATAEMQLCQRIGGATAWLDRDGLIVPSARRPDGTNLVIYPHRQNLALGSFEVLEKRTISPS